MPKRPNLLNVRSHLEHIALILDGLDRYGMCPAVKDELAKIKLINRAILKRADTKRAQGNRHDLYVGVSE